MSYFFIVNPGSKHFKGARRIQEIFAALRKRRIEFEYQETSSLSDACRISIAANQKGYEVIVAVGGDGTINQVINGFFDQQGKRISTSKLGVIHTGTSPDFCLSYGIPTQPLLALDTVLTGITKKIPIAKIELHYGAGERVTRYFACCASLGLGASVAKTSNAGIRKYLGDTAGTFVSILSALCSYKASDLLLVCDGTEDIVQKNYNTFIGKTSYVASGLKVAHRLTQDDQRMYVLRVQKITLFNVIPALRAIYSGRMISDRDYISVSYASSIEIRKGKINNEIEFDGDPQGFLPCRICSAEDKLEVIVNEL
jgi:diacylglycerol kinase family enzyme